MKIIDLETISRWFNRDSTRLKQAPLDRFSHTFGTVISPLNLIDEENKPHQDLAAAREKFLDEISQISFNINESQKIRPILELAQQPWTYEIVKEIIEANEIAFQEEDLGQRTLRSQHLKKQR